MIQMTDFIGCKIYHFGWGEGTIEEFDDTCLVVHFLKTNTGERSVKFQFPKAFADSFLHFTDQALQNRIDLLIANNKCFFCNEIGVQTELIDGKRVCAHCKNEHMTKCPFCNEVHETDFMGKYYPDENSIKSVFICHECADNHTFVCEHCNKRLHTNQKVSSKVSDKTLCKKCLPNVIRECHFCKNLFDIKKGDTFYDYDEGGTVYVCPSCLATHTFTCTECGYEKLTTSRFTSEYITDDCNVCKSCVSECSICNEFFPDSKIVKSFGKNVCPHCWEKLKKQCPICNDDYIPEIHTDQLCPDCENMQLYVARLQTLDLSTCKYKTLTYGQLEHVDRCDLFTQLLVHCADKRYYIFKKQYTESFNFLVLKMFRYNLVITFLNRDIIDNTKHSLNITMTQLRSNKGYSSIHRAVTRWAPTSKNIMNTVAGEMRILNYPILLRVQTEYDKIYGKEWNGPYDYIEIGNYGDTTDFYIIGFIE